jgi:hypothetical protein
MDAQRPPCQGEGRGFEARRPLQGKCWSGALFGRPSALRRRRAELVAAARGAGSPACLLRRRLPCLQASRARLATSPRTTTSTDLTESYQVPLQYQGVPAARTPHAANGAEMHRTLGPVGKARDQTHRTRRTANHRNQVTAAHRTGRYNDPNRREILREHARAREPRSAHEHLRSAEAADSGRERPMTSRWRPNRASNAGRTRKSGSLPVRRRSTTPRGSPSTTCAKACSSGASSTRPGRRYPARNRTFSTSTRRLLPRLRYAPMGVLKSWYE